MGRSVNSFTSYVGHAEETITDDDDRVTLPKKISGLRSYAERCWMPVKGPPDLDMKDEQILSQKSL